ncbi:MAG: sigma-70 family RNA polymerase sigma factor [Leptolyngbyaceae cyanobacterium]
MDSETSFTEDGQLWDQIMAGDIEAMAVLYDRHAGLVYGIALKVLHDPQEAEDLVQDIFVQLVKRSTYDPRRGSLRTYLSIMTRSRAIDRLRSRQSTQRSVNRLTAEQPTVTDDTPTDIVSREEENQAVRDALAQLSESQKQVLRLAYYEGLPQTQIAKRLKTPLGTVKTRARQGLIKLRQILTRQHR